MMRRPRRSIPATVFGLILLAICVLVALSAIQALTGHPPLIPFTALAEFGARQRWSEAVVLFAGAAAVALGVFLLACGLWPGTPTVLALAARAPAPAQDTDQLGAATPPSYPTDAGVTRRGLTRALRAALNDTPGVTTTQLRVGRRRIRATLRTEDRETPAVHAAAREALQQRLQGIPLRGAPRLRLRVKRQRRTT